MEPLCWLLKLCTHHQQVLVEGRGRGRGGEMGRRGRVNGQVDRQEFGCVVWLLLRNHLMAGTCQCSVPVLLSKCEMSV